MKISTLKIIILLSISALSGCQKGFLDKKPNKALLVPTTLTDFQALLDNLSIMNVVPTIERIATDDFYTSYAGWQAYHNPAERNSYIWATDIYQGTTSSDWNAPYQQIFYANIVLDGLNNVSLDANSQIDFNRVKGSALFYRALAFYHLAQLFCKQYNQATAGTDLGVPLPLTSDVNKRPGRGNVQKVYDQIIQDLSEASPLLPVNATLKSRPSQPAVFALLARVYLTMGNYNEAADFSSQCLQLKNTLIDYNTLSLTASSPFPSDLPNGNDEVLYHAVALNYSYYTSAVTGIDTVLLSSYTTNDLRKTIFFVYPANKYAYFKNTYASPAGTFAGLAIDEVFITRAECYARLGDVTGAMKDLNTVLIKRFKSGTFVPFTATSADDALKLVITERRKELQTNQGILRWVDLRRLNSDLRFAVTLKHVLNGKEYTLPPGDNRYVYPIPDNEIAGSGIEQNQR